MRHALRVALGIGLVILGIIGLILPIMPGWVFLIPGLVILGDYFPPIKRLLNWAKDKAEKAGVMGGDKPKEPPPQPAATSPSPSSSSSPAPDTYQP
ncbi:MAG: PGPGW domain-containing protein [Acidobacteriota bacterium]